MEKGIKGSLALTVTMELTAASVGSGDVRVFSTPMMIANMEKTCLESVKSHLEEGYSTVGTLVNVRHLASAPLGMKVRIESELIEVDRRRLVFNVAAFDEYEKIGEGIHERFIVNKEKFLEKVCQKKPHSQP